VHGNILNEIPNQRMQRTAPLMRETLDSELRMRKRDFFESSWAEHGGVLSASKT
jgi:hypothetical protein